MGLSMNSDTSEPKRARPSPLWLLAGAGVLAAGFGLMRAAGANSQGTTATERVELPPLVEVVGVEAAGSLFTVRAPGRLEPRQQLTLVGEVPGKLVEIHPGLVLGGRVARGDVLLRIDSGDYSADLARAEAALTTAKARFEQVAAERDRQVRLADIGASPQKAREAALAAYEDARAAIQQAESQVTIARRSVTKTVIRAPFDAIVAQENVSLGGYVAPGAPLATLIDARAGELVAGLSPQDVRAVRAALAGDPDGRLDVRAVPNEGSISALALQGTLEQFSPVIDPASRTVSVVAVFPDAFAPEHDGFVFAGDFMTLEISAQADGAVWRVPASAVRQDAYVWVVTDTGAVHRADVQPLDRTDADIFVLSRDLAGGERLMTTILPEEIDGMKVRVAEAGQ